MTTIKQHDGEIKCALGIDAIEFGKLLECVKTIEKNTDDIKARLDQQNGRIGRLERWRAYILGAFAVASFVAPIILHQVGVI